jgi:diaminopimelate decarboxylase
MAQTDTMARRQAFPGESATTAGDGADLMARCCAWQDALPHTEVVFPAGILPVAATAKWARAQRACVGVRTEHELALTISAGIHPGRAVFFCDHAVTRTVWHAVGLGVGRFVVGATDQLMTVSACAPVPQRVLLDITAGPVGELLAAARAEERLELIGLHCQLDNAGQTDHIARAVGHMAQFSRDHAVVLTRVSLGVSEPPGGSPQALSAWGAAIDAALESNCRRLRLPRPAVMVSPHWRTLAAAV